MSSGFLGERSLGWKRSIRESGTSSTVNEKRIFYAQDVPSREAPQYGMINLT